MNDNIEDKIYDLIDISDDVITDKFFMNCSFNNCKFQDITLNNCKFINCIFNNCDILNITYSHVEINSLVFDNCNIISVNFTDFIIDNLLNRPIEKINNSTLKYTSFYKYPLENIDLTCNHILYSDFDNCNMSGIKLNGCDLAKTKFNFNNLTEADFRDAINYEINIENNNIKSAKFSFNEVYNLLENLDIEIY